MNEPLIVSCIRNTNAEGCLTLHKLYTVLHDNPSGKMYRVLTDNGFQLDYNYNRFTVVVSKVILDGWDTP